MRPLTYQLVVLAAERDNPVAARCARELRHLVAPQSCTVHEPIRFYVAGRRGDPHAVRSRGEPDDCGVRPQFTASGLDLIDQRAAHGAVVDNPGAGDQQRLHTRAMGLQLGQPARVDQLCRNAIARRSLGKHRQPLALGAIHCHDHLAAHLVRNAALLAELDHRSTPGDRQGRLGRPRPVVHARVQHTRVATGLVQPGTFLGLTDHHPAARMICQIPVRRGQADDASPHNGEFSTYRRGRGAGHWGEASRATKREGSLLRASSRVGGNE